MEKLEYLHQQYMEAKLRYEIAKNFIEFTVIWNTREDYDFKTNNGTVLQILGGVDSVYMLEKKIFPNNLKFYIDWYLEAYEYTHNKNFDNWHKIKQLESSVIFLSNEYERDKNFFLSATDEMFSELKLK